MKRANSLVCLLLVSSFSILVNGCGKSNDNSSDEEKLAIPSVSENLRVLNGVNFDYSKAFFDDFTNGVDYDKWLISEDCWGSNRGGITVKNLFYTDEGTLLLRANGNYYSGDEVVGYGSVKDGRDTGAALVSKFVTGPGRYQVKMKPMPRLGGCTAFWTYCNKPVAGAENDNHEIDIELPGGMDSGHSFQKMMNTNYITEKYTDHDDFIVAEVTNNKVINLNDGEWHTFGFDWYTNPEVIVYYVDDIVTCVSNVFVPYLLTRIWVGVWISKTDTFMGPPNFESDFMEIDWINYIPFDETQPYTECDVDIVSKSCTKEEYPSSPVSRPVVNKIASGDFEYFARKGIQEGYGWDLSKFITEKADLSEVCYVSETAGKDGTCGAVISRGGYMTTDIDAAYEGYEYDLSFDATSDGDDSVVEIVYYANTVTDGEIIDSEVIRLDRSNWLNYKKTIVCPPKCGCISIEFYNLNENSTTTMSIDNVVMHKVK